MLEGKKAYEDFEGGTPSPYKNFSLPEEFAKQLRPLTAPPEPSAPPLPAEGPGPTAPAETPAAGRPDYVPPDQSGPGKITSGLDPMREALGFGPTVKEVLPKGVESTVPASTIPPAIDPVALAREREAEGPAPVVVPPDVRGAAESDDQTAVGQAQNREAVAGDLAGGADAMADNAAQEMSELTKAVKDLRHAIESKGGGEEAENAVEGVGSAVAGAMGKESDEPNVIGTAAHVLEAVASAIPGVF